MATDVDVCNLAMVAMGQDPISSLDENSKRANACKAIYAQVVKGELRKYLWKFAKKRVLLSASLKAPIGKAYQYKIPSDCARLIIARDVDWEYENSMILTNESGPLTVTYIRHVTNENEMDALFIDLVAAEIAVRLIEPLRLNVEKGKKMLALYERAYNFAKKADAFEQLPVLRSEDPWEVATR